jgi:hypothetical protein
VFSGYYAPTWGADASGFTKALASGWSLSWIASAQSGLPYPERVANDLNNDGNRNNDIVPGSRNVHRLPWTKTIDARVSRQIPIGGRARLELIAEAFNLLNSTNITAQQATLYNYNGTVLIPQTNLANPRQNFGADQSTQVNFEDTQRIVQLAAKITF